MNIEEKVSAETRSDESVPSSFFSVRKLTQSYFDEMKLFLDAIAQF